MEPPRRRVFLGLWPGAALRLRLAAHRDAWTWPAQARRVGDGRLHLTLHFLGELPAAQVEALAAALPPAPGLAVPGFELQLDAPALWPQGLAVLEPSAVPPELLALHDQLGRWLRGHGLAPETRRFRPHVTLARQAGGARPPADGGGLPLRWAVRGHALLETLPQAGYRVLASSG